LIDGRLRVPLAHFICPFTIVCINSMPIKELKAARSRFVIQFETDTLEFIHHYIHP